MKKQKRQNWLLRLITVTCLFFLTSCGDPVHDTAHELVNEWIRDNGEYTVTCEYIEIGEEKPLDEYSKWKHNKAYLSNGKVLDFRIKHYYATDYIEVYAFDLDQELSN